ncbi:GNAT family N-acetyltransferase [Clostridiaceae bacterium NSJ-31]|uniref:GNAT family N-acetyltransferase n=2 Tax=Ligaoa zhengdingensis TaxID=2763658 RepID=A0A926I0H4_9FIRM|nr:GNAT family N-acetyltransferase [Ligaoa zhengdingensis]MBC8547007.1 GNAT family N-acetyltransferase [Ligaoa zhengdingensis]
MNLELIRLNSNSKDRKYFEQINDEAFPLSERMSFDEIFDFASDTDTDVLGIYDDGNPVGFVVLLKNGECGYVYFIAIDSCTRSKGYGSVAMQKMMETYPELQLVLDFEVIDENAENNAQRVRRKNFYLRNGFHETGNYTMLRDERFEVVCNGGELRKAALKDLLRVLHEHRPEFPDVLI